MKKVILNDEILDSFLFMDMYERTDRLGLRGSFALGAVMERDEEDVPAGIIVCTRANDTLVIEWLYTVPEYRGLGLGRRVVEEAETWARELGYVTVAIDARVEAVGFYEKLGYAQDDEEIVRSGTFDCIKMSKKVGTV